MPRTVRALRRAISVFARKRSATSPGVSRSQGFLDAIVMIAPDAIIAIDADQKIVLFNETAERIFGWSAQAMVGKPIERLLPHRFRKAHRGNVRRFARAQEESPRPMGARRQVRGLRRNGEEFPAEAGIVEFWVDDAAYFIAVVRDVTERHQVQEEQRIVAELGQVLMEAGADEEAIVDEIARVLVREFADWAIVDLVEDGTVRRVRVDCSLAQCRAIADALERSQPDRSRPHLMNAALTADEVLLVPEVTDAYLRSVSCCPDHLALLRSLEAKSFLAVPLMVGGERLGAIGLLCSRRPQRYDEADLRMARRLAHLAALAIVNARLHRETKRAVRARDDVLGLVAHDLKGHLANVIMSVELLSSRMGAEGDERQLRTVQRIGRAAQRMNRLIRDLLDVHRLERGGLAIEPRLCSVAELIEEAVEEHREKADRESIDLDTEVGGRLPDIPLDRDRLLQVLENLIGNAIKFTDAGGRIRVGAEPASETVRLWVRDEGRGIPRDDVAHIFDRFYQVGGKRRGGAGLGLAIVRGIVRAHGGDVAVDSVLGQGTTFSITLPRGRAAEARCR